MKRNKQRRKENAAIDRILDDLEEKYCAQVADAVDFVRVDAAEQALIAELEQLIAEGKLPAPPDRHSLQWRASSVINWALSMLPMDPRRMKPNDDDDDCQLCRMVAGDIRVSPTSQRAHIEYVGSAPALLGSAS